MQQTMMNIGQQSAFLSDNWRYARISHKWSCRGMGNSKILNGADEVIGKASGCGYDRFGTALGDAITTMFPQQLLELAKRECKGRRRNYKQAPRFYGLFYNSITGKAWVDGGCGSDCMKKILNKIGFSLSSAGVTNIHASTGQEFFTIAPLTKHERKYL